MPNIKSAEKRVRQTKARKVQNAVEEGTKDEAEAQLKLFFQSVDKAAKQNVIHKNAAARYKSAMSKLVGAKS